MSDTTFTDSDVLRIYEKHLDAQERENVRLAIASEIDSDMHRAVSLIEDLVERAPGTLVSAQVTLGLLEMWMTASFRKLGTKHFERINFLAEDLLYAVETLDTLRRMVSKLARLVPGDQDLFEEMLPFFDEVRDRLREALFFATVPKNLFSELDNLRDLVVELDDVRDTVDRLAFILEAPGE